MRDFVTPGGLKQRNRRTAMWLMGWILLLIVLSVIVAWFRGQIGLRGG
jgi:hypothetical protein